MALNIEALMVMLVDCDERIANIKYQSQRTHCSSKLKENGENGIKLVKVEKMIIIALTKVGNNAIFPRLLVKYDDLMRESYQLADDRVQEGIKEDLYLKYCADSLEQRKYIKTLCDYGMTR